MERADQQLEYDAIRSSAGLRILSNRLFVRISGDDRVGFMHGMCSADVKSLVPGKLTRALFLTEHARVIADVFIYALEEQALWLELDRPRWPAVRDHLDRFLVADDIELEELDALAALDIEGPGSMNVVAGHFGAGARELREWQHLACNEFRVANLPRYGGPAFTIVASEAALEMLVERLIYQRPEVRELHADTLDILRIESGSPLIGIDTDERTLALEARLDSGISFNKGCYVGQETIERATAHGSLKRRLCGLRIDGDEVPQLGAVIKLEGKEVGRLSSVARAPLARVIGLGILHHSAWPVGTCVSIICDKGTFSAAVSELPFLGPRSAAANEAQT
jgi:folate-binding protein YgfZ